ncbi:hypothetical protein BAE44_0014629 [Dichanthelium oligosanthes]|uniref:HMA domain-containing protein n=1 Tax=Dichanthelium oligosanthes TaxID=888268 RepID=A0A1E5VGU2_9POAL|nr:hypothetical protein BAE44_0014629 [Dichanthelium oligosanthes]
MSKVTVLKVDTSCAKCKRKVLQAVSGLQGIDKIEVDSEKSTMTVTGTVDPVNVIKQARKAGRRASVVSIGSPPKPAEEKKPEEQKKTTEEKKTSADAEKKAPEQPATVFVHHVPSWPSCPRYQERVVYEQDPPPCSIM